MAASDNVQETTLEDLGALLDAGNGAVVTLVAGKTRLAAHRAVLAARSPVFKAMFHHDTLEASSGLVDIPDVEGPVLRQLLAYIYTLQAPQLPSMAPQMLAAADKYGLLTLKTQCEQQLAAQLAVETLAATAVLALRHSCTRLRQAAATFMKAHNNQVVMTEAWADALVNNPVLVVELTRLTAEPLAESSTQSRTPVAAAPPNPPCQTSPQDGSTVSNMRSLALEKGRKLIWAAEDGRVEDVDRLLAAGADVGARDGERETALHWAAFYGHVEVVKCLLRGGAHVDAINDWENTPLYYAVESGHVAVVRLLLAFSADVNARDAGGMTPLHRAAIFGTAEAAAVLLEAGADRGATDDKGKTPLDIARHYKKQQVIHLLK